MITVAVLGNDTTVFRTRMKLHVTAITAAAAVALG